jgi:hypothetical protein
MSIIELVDLNGCFNEQPASKKIKIKKDRTLILSTLYLSESSLQSFT